MLRITSIVMTGTDTQDFIPSQDCVGASLDPSQTCDLKVSFQPTAAGPRQATLVIHQNLPWPDHGTTITLTGTGSGDTTPTDTCLQGMCGVKPSLVTTYASHPKPARRLPRTTAWPPAAAVPLAAHMALTPVCRDMCGAKPSLVTTYASHLKPARKPPTTIIRPPVGAPDSYCTSEAEFGQDWPDEEPG